jgi:hypothetical protein
LLYATKAIETELVKLKNVYLFEKSEAYLKDNVQAINNKFCNSTNYKKAGYLHNESLSAIKVKGVTKLLENIIKR